MDAIIINGSSLEVGAVGATRHVKNPVLLARRVLENTAHVFLVGVYAEDFAESEGLEIVPTHELIVNSTCTPKSNKLVP